MATMEYVEDSVEDEVDGEEEVDDEKVWGRLFSVAKGFAAMDLVDEQYLFGRGDECDYCFENNGRHNDHFRTFSSKHFRLYKEHNKSSSDNYLVFIEDLSSNGTFVNGEKIGKNKKRVLNSDDEIALSFKKNKVFIFNDRGATESSSNLPQEFKRKYTISKFLGRGACGEVKMAFDKSTGQRYAVKIISKKTFSVGPQLGRAAIEEVNILKSMQHPCVIHVEDLFESSDTLYIVLELVEGGELFDRVVSVGKFSERTAKLLFYQMLVAVKYLHDKGVTHRDMKPENVLLSDDKQETLVKVTDFGLSRFVGENSLMKTLCGTPSYLAPEIIKSAGLDGYSKAVDCWSLGVILYIMLGGYPPFSDEIKEYSLKDQICQGRYSFPNAYWKDISDDAMDLIKKLLTIDPKKRISTDGALEHKWMTDTEIIDQANKLMKEGALKHNMPPPVLPTRKRSLSSSDCNKTESTSKRRVSDETPSPAVTDSPPTPQLKTVNAVTFSNSSLSSDTDNNTHIITAEL